MATTTSNFGWPIPQSTDLVKDGATAIAGLGSGVDTSMAQLKGGTTGQMLTKTSNTDMAFTWITPQIGDITAVTAGTGISGGGTTGDVTITNSMATTIDAKGDLIAGTGNDAFAKLTVGSDGNILVANSAASTGLGWAGGILAGKNKIINGDFGIWQRGTSATFSGSAATYVGTDRWWNYGGATCTISRQTADTTGATYGARFGRNSGQTNTTIVYLGQVFESATSKPLAGQTVTLSFYAKKGADAPTTLTAQVYSGTGTDQTAVQLFGGWTGGASVINNNFTTTTTMTRYTYSGTVPSGSNQLAIYFQYTPTGTAGTNEWFQIENVQLEAGSVATSFTTATGTIQGELAACQRYYQRYGTSSNARTGWMMNAFSTTRVYATKSLPVSMRSTITAVDYSSIGLSDGVNATIAITSAVINVGDPQAPNIYFDVASGLTQYRVYEVINNASATGYIGISAEL